MNRDRVETLQNAVTTAANGLPLDVAGRSAAACQVVGAGTYTIEFEATIDGSNWNALMGQNLATMATAPSATAAGAFQFPVAGLQYMRARISAYTSGTIYVYGRVSGGAFGSVER